MLQNRSLGQINKQILEIKGKISISVMEFPNKFICINSTFLVKFSTLHKIHSKHYQMDLSNLPGLLNLLKESLMRTK